MKKIKLAASLAAALLAVATVGCSPKADNSDPLPSWKQTEMKKSITDYVAVAIKEIPVEDRIAVFDLDGTLACETPLWGEMYCAVANLNMQNEKDPTLLNDTAYMYAQKLGINPADTSITNHWAGKNFNYVDSMVWKAFAGVDNEKYVEFCKNYLDTAKSRDYKMPLAKMFYQPMVELLNYLKANGFTVYVVSGSMQGMLWGLCPDQIGIDRAHLIGTWQQMSPVYTPNSNTQFILQKGIFSPKDDKNGKSLNIYHQIGKTPVFAFGNTTGDFGMFHLTSTSTYPHAAYLLNHDDTTREYAYPPYHGTADLGWRDSLTNNGWNLVNMKENFETVWMK